MEATYRRADLELAAWRSLSNRHYEPGQGKPPRIFLNRIKRLLDLDVDTERPIFTTHGPLGKGNPAKYNAFGVFLVVFGLTLIDAGITQGDVIFVLKHTRADFLENYQRILAIDPELRMRVLARDRPHSPTMIEDSKFADTSIFFIVRKAEITELWNRDNVPDPLFLDPKFCYGMRELVERLARLGFSDPARLVIEIGGMTVMTRTHLSKIDLLSNL